MQDVRVFRASHAAAFGLGVLDIVQYLFGDALAGGEDGDARRVAHDELAAHHALGLAQGQALLGGVERFLRAGSDLGVNVLLAQQARTVGVVAAFDFGQCADKALDLLRAVTDGEISQYIENYIEAYCGDIPDSELSEEARDKKLYVLARSVQKGGMRLTYGDVSRAGDYEYIEYTLEYPLSAAMFGYSSQHTYKGLARYFVS